MEYQFPPINYLYLVACLMACALAVFSLGQAHTRSGKLWVAVMASFGLWTFGELVANAGTTLAWQVGFQRVVYLGVISATTSWLLFAICFSGYGRWLGKRLVVILLVVPFSSIALVMTLDHHQLLYTGAVLLERDGYLVLDPEYGVGFWLHLLCAHLFTMAGSLLLLNASIKQPQVYRGQSLLIGIAALMPVVPNMMYVAGIDLAGGFDPTSLFFVVSAILVTVATHQYHFLSLTPVARDRVFDQINIAVVVANEKHQISDVNPAFVDMTGEALADLAGLTVADVLLRYFKGVDVSVIESGWQGRLTALDNERHYDVTSMPIRGNNHKVMGYLVLLNDVTQIQKALDEISRLAGPDDSDRDDV
ncbi:histidine kinase N-terminal 7TM domain-containing protein [Pseudohongiella sp.]|uniref:PAC domain-containing protein n=1 Tax=marine sediment metagenome TaxID=412755 RepID=A0A0F9W120_9ZZZZ|nr:histidine kinase N-terminal 7TM domain-containing protein [Pseudohongiella sp.]HDZ09577.1 PAS domain S-box protein [Pseudohongiella sp.]HEA62491.1 PAS domain S-box protein [Pseudohongiella sp.]